MSTQYGDMNGNKLEMTPMKASMTQHTYDALPKHMQQYYDLQYEVWQTQQAYEIASASAKMIAKRVERIAELLATGDTDAGLPRDLEHYSKVLYVANSHLKRMEDAINTGFKKMTEIYQENK